MRHRIGALGKAVIVTSMLSCFLAGPGRSEEVRIDVLQVRDNLSLKNEIQHAVERGLQWLGTVQAPDGYWSQADHPALTGLVLLAFMNEPTGRFKSDPPSFLVKGYEYLLRCVKPDGGIYVKDLTNYNTAVSVMPLAIAYNPSYQPILVKARSYLAGLQDDLGEKGKPDTPFDGGIGYGGTYQHSDMSNTMFALEALYYTKFLTSEQTAREGEIKELNWQAAVTFITRCQNLPQYNDQPWASDDPENKGGFIYFPGDSKAGEMKLPSGKTALRSYASISYAGLLSYIYADLDREDPRVKSVFDWLVRNYTLEENPGMGEQGLYYYYHTMAKALSSYGVQALVLEDGRKVDWRKDLALKLLNLQRSDGSWVNDNGRWWEKDPVLVTSYAAITLEIIYKGL